jgi:hypothetical protein
MLSVSDCTPARAEKRGAGVDDHQHRGKQTSMDTVRNNTHSVQSNQQNSAGEGRPEPAAERQPVQADALPQPDAVVRDGAAVPQVVAAADAVVAAADAVVAAADAVVAAADAANSGDIFGPAELLREVTQDRPCRVRGCGATSGCLVRTDGANFVVCINVGGPLAEPGVWPATGRTYHRHELHPDTRQVVEPVPDDLVRFVNAVFEPGDAILIRPVETWTDGSRKRSEIDFKHTVHVYANRLATRPDHWHCAYYHAAKARANLFFGVCPRWSGSDQFDRAFQIRVVRCLWSDLDHCNVEKALARCEAAGLPRPTAVINSGNGVHVYWRLSEPYLIDDAGDPPAVRKEWPPRQEEDKARRPRHFIGRPGGERVYEYHADDTGADDRHKPNHEWPDALSPKAEHIQHVVAGIAAKIGGDHTQDISRLLRLPCTLNRKDQRNGKEPVPCVLVECDDSRRYPLADFERFAEEAPAYIEAQELAKVQLPSGKKLTPTRLNKLTEYLNRSKFADDRSDADFALCCYAVEQGYDREEIWTAVEKVGKFQERGREYFDLTWGNAERKVREQAYERASPTGWRRRGRGHAGDNGDTEGGMDFADLPTFRNYDEVKDPGAEEGDEPVKLALPPEEIRRQLLKLADGFPKRVGDRLFATSGGEVLWIENSSQLFAWIGSVLERPKRLTNGLDWVKGSDKVTEAVFFAFLQQTVEDFDSVEELPHYPPLPRTYYVPREPEGGDGERLRQMVQFFRPATLVDHDLIVAFFLSLFWGGKPGQRPAWLVTAEDENDAEKGRGIGKTTLVEMGGYLVGGAVSIGAKEEYARIVTRLLSGEARGKRVVLLDNVKSLKFSWAELEALITCDTISGHHLFHGEGRRPNTLTWCITLNGATLSKDLAQRCVIVKLKRPEHDATWEDRVTAFIDEHRWAIVGDCLEILKQPARPLARHSRWGAWEDAVLSHTAEVAEAQRVIEERQAEVDDDRAESDTVREAFVAELTLRRHDPDHDVVWISSREAAVLVNEATLEKRPVNKANAYLRTLHIEELRRSNRGTGRGWTWTGLDSPPGAEAVILSSHPLGC